MAKIDPSKLPLATPTTPGVITGADLQNLNKLDALTEAAANKAPATHDHDSLYYAKAAVDAALAAKANTGHTHAIAQITNLTGELAAKAAVGHTHTVSDIVSGLEAAIDNRIIDNWQGKTNGVASLSGGIVPSEQLPPITVTTTFVKASEAEMLGLSTASVGNICVRTDNGKTYILAAADYTDINSWQELLTSGSSTVTSVNNKLGPAVLLTASDVGASPEGHLHTGVYAPVLHTHTIANVTGLQIALDGKAATTHNHDTRYYSKTDIDDKLAGKANTGHTHTVADITGLQNALDAKANTNHTHTTSAILNFDGTVDNRITSAKGVSNGIASLVNGKIPSSQLPPLVVTTVTTVTNEADKPTNGNVGDICIVTSSQKTYVLKAKPSDWVQMLSPAGTITSVNGQAGPTVTLDYTHIGAAPVSHNALHDGVYAPISHTSDPGVVHTIANIANLGTTLDGKAQVGHPVTMDQIQATGTRDNTKFLRGDGTWSDLSSSSSGFIQSAGPTLVSTYIEIAHAADTNYKRLYSVFEQTVSGWQALPIGIGSNLIEVSMTDTTTRFTNKYGVAKTLKVCVIV